VATFRSFKLKIPAQQAVVVCLSCSKHVGTMLLAANVKVEVCGFQVVLVCQMKAVLYFSNSLK